MEINPATRLVTIQLRKKSWCLLTPAPPNDLGESRYRKEINYIEGVVHPQFLIGHGHFEDWTQSFPKLDSVDAKKQQPLKIIAKCQKLSQN